jgi:hypothetical protein
VKITVLWEDQRGGIMKGFGPHELLVSCVADELRCQRHLVTTYIVPAPRKGNGNVIRTLKQDLSKLSRSGPASCLSGIRAAVSVSAPGDYELILLDENVETLVTACCGAIGSIAPVAKPSPDERDRLLGRAAWAAANVRGRVRRDVPSFNRLVQWVAKKVPATSPG